MRSTVLIVAIGPLLLISNTATAQSDSVSHPARERTPARVWIVPVGIVVSTALDPEIREWALRTHSRSLDHFAKLVNPLGTTGRLAPAIA
ncbi:MAG TPA: hypothetical protein VN876_04390, partial [Gemmatimonadaceae bacterium]|nr:hypothetical protein [Gemmatimonadaceae bacterium]